MSVGSRMLVCAGLFIASSTLQGNEVAGLPSSGDFLVRGNNDDSSGVYAEVDLLFMKYHRAEGVRVGTGADDNGGNFGYDLAPKVTLGYQGENGLGTRLSYWQYDQTANVGTTPGQFINVDTYTIDFEVYRYIQFRSGWNAEFSGGLRYQNWNETLNEPGRGAFSSDFDGFGVTAGLEVGHAVTDRTSLYTHAKFAVVMGDGVIMDRVAAPYAERVSQQTELGVGLEHTRSIFCHDVYFRGGLEFWQFDDLSGVFDSNSDFDDTSAVGFGGFVLKLGFRY